MKFQIAKTFAEFSFQFSRDVKPYKRRWGPAFESELVGKLRGRFIYLQKTKHLYTNCFSRRFIGEIVENEAGITIEGKFKSPLIFEVIWSIILLPLPFFETIQNIGNIKESIPYFLTFLGFALFIIAVHHFSIWICKNEEKAVVEYLENIASQEDGR